VSSDAGASCGRDGDIGFMRRRHRLHGGRAVRLRRKRRRDRTSDGRITALDGARAYLGRSGRAGPVLIPVPMLSNDFRDQRRARWAPATPPPAHARRAWHLPASERQNTQSSSRRADGHGRAPGDPKPAAGECSPCRPLVNPDSSPRTDRRKHAKWSETEVQPGLEHFTRFLIGQHKCPSCRTFRSRRSDSNRGPLHYE
jgi:hypothetical protein